MEPGIAVVESVNVGEDHETLCPTEDGDDRGEHVVISEEPVLRLDLRVAYRVIFIYDRDDPHLQQGVEGVGQVFFFFLLLDILCV